ncbi:MAG: hypothetical protein WCL02_02440 [bacterium]
MYKKTQHKRRRIKIRKFFEDYLLPIVLTIIILFALFIGFVLFGGKFTSLTHLIVSIGLGIFILGRLFFEVSKLIVKKIFK